MKRIDNKILIARLRKDFNMSYKDLSDQQMLDATGMHITEPNYFIAEPIAIKPPPLTGKVSVYDELDTYVYIAKSIEFKGVVKVGWTSKTPLFG